MTDEHVWVTIGGKPLYVGQVSKPKEKPPENACLDALKAKRKRRQNPPPAPVEIFQDD